MPHLEIIPVKSRREKQSFLNLPWRIYRDDPHWIPPLCGNQRQLVGFARHPFYDDAAAQAFLALSDGTPCGRILAIANHAHARRHGERRGFFGFYESIDDGEVTGRLLDAACNWHREQGNQQLIGPVNPSLNYECGLLVEGFDSPPFFMMTYNPPYYARLLEAYGLVKAQDLYAYWGHIQMAEGLSPKHQRIHDAVIERFGIHVRPMDPRRFAEEVRTFCDLYNASLGGTWGFVPLSDAEMRTMSAGLRHLIVPELTRVAEVDGRAIGAAIGLLDYNPRIRQIDGRLWPLGFWKLTRNKQAIRRARFLSANVLPEWQRWGVGLMLLREFLQPVIDWGIEEVEFSWVLESNDLSRMTLDKGGAKRHKTYRIYDHSLA